MQAYKKRMIEEYNQLKTRRNKLEKIINQIEAGTCSFYPNSPRYMLIQQLEHMNGYLGVLKLRAEYEGIELEY